MIDFNNKEDVKKLFDFTFYISGECPNEIFGGSYNCSTDKEIEDCVMCWRKALSNKKEELKG